MSDDVVLTPYGKRYRVVEPLRYRELTVPAGYVTDLASIPRVLWPIVGSPYDPRFAKAATVHDYLYSTKQVPREEADKELKTLLRLAGVPRWKCQAMYLAVRAFGGLHW